MESTVCTRKKVKTGEVCGKEAIDGTDRCKDCWKLVGVYESGKTNIPLFAHQAYKKKKRIPQ